MRPRVGVYRRFFLAVMMAGHLAGACSFGIDVPALSECVESAESDCAPRARDAEGERDAQADVALPEASAACPAGRGPGMVRVPSEPAFCIDATEVTGDQYAAFLASAERPPPASLAAACRARTTFTPRGAWPLQPGRGSNPVAFVDFCDAQAFCAWSGKRLCGTPEGKALDVALTARAPFDAWFMACGGARAAYPYGNVYDAASSCNGVDQGASASLPVTSLPSCRSGADGPADMSGNLWEWTDACESDVDVATDRCFARGGAFNAPASELTCASRRASTRGEADATIGFRCCAP